MIDRRLEHYRSSLSRPETNVLSAPDVAAHQGAAAEPWFAGYRVITDHGNLTASYVDTKPLCIRPITWHLSNTGPAATSSRVTVSRRTTSRR